MKTLMVLILSIYASTVLAEGESVRSKWAITEQERSCLHLNAYFEGANDTITAHQGFIETVLNRRARTNFPNDACQVIFESSAFSWTMDEYRIHKNQKHVFKLVALTVDAILDGLTSGILKEITFGATFYHAHYVTPCWIPDMKLTNKLGQHLFYVQVRKTGACSKPIVATNNE